MFSLNQRNGAVLQYFVVIASHFHRDYSPQVATALPSVR
jgi:hypothetical protein